MGRSYDFVRKHQRRLGVKWTAPPKASKPPSKVLRQWTLVDDERLRFLAENGWTVGLAAVELDWDIKRVTRRAKALGLTWTAADHHRSRRGADLPDALRL